MKNTFQCRISGRAGFALPMAMGMFLCASIAFGGVLSYVMCSTRYVKGELAKANCLAAAQSAIERFKSEIATGFRGYVSSQSASGNTKVTIGDYGSRTEFRDWFHVTSSSSGVLIGNDAVKVRHPAVERDERNGCNVYVHAFEPNASDLAITIVATGADGHGNAVTVAEKFSYTAAIRSAVFNNAYFVNNYGWMNGSSIVLNGDMRANGDISVTGSVVNGRIYSAPNPEVGAAGEISFAPVSTVVGYDRWGRAKLSYTYPQVWGREKYYENVSSYARPTSPPHESFKSIWNGGFSAPDSDITLDMDALSNPNKPGHAYVCEASAGIAMPYISDLSDYKEFAQQLHSKGGNTASATLKYCPYVPDSDAVVDTANPQTITVSNYTQDDNLSTKWGNEMVASAEAGPSGDLNQGDRGAVVLVGTYDHPIEIDGPVIIASDVVIMGYITGQGTIYSGRNVHIVGDLTYKNPPSWTHPDSNPESTRDVNQERDLVSLMAKGCVVVGDCTDSDWKNAMAQYIAPSGDEAITKRYYCDANDTSIGYPDPKTSMFSGDYTAVIADAVPNSEVKRYYDKAWAVPVKVTEKYNSKKKKWETSNTEYGTPRYMDLSEPYCANRVDDSKEVVDSSETVASSDGKSRTTTHYPVIGNTSDPHYSLIQNKNYSQSSYPRNKSIRYYDSVVDEKLISKLATSGNGKVYGKNSFGTPNRVAGVSQIDAVIYNNHGTFGWVGQPGRGFTLNGSLICRDEGLVGHNMNNGDKLVFNWDIRLKGDGAEAISNEKLSLPTEPAPQTILWQIVPSTAEWNPNYDPNGSVGG